MTGIGKVHSSEHDSRSSEPGAKAVGHPLGSAPEPWLITCFPWKLSLVFSQPGAVSCILLCPAWRLVGRWVGVCHMDKSDGDCDTMKEQSILSRQSFRVNNSELQVDGVLGGSFE